MSPAHSSGPSLRILNSQRKRLFSGKPEERSDGCDGMLDSKLTFNNRMVKSQDNASFDVAFVRLLRIWINLPGIPAPISVVDFVPGTSLNILNSVSPSRSRSRIPDTFIG